MLARFTLNFLIYLVFGGGIFAFVAMRGPADARPGFSTVAVAALVLAAWSGGLTTLIETVVARMPSMGKRAAVAGAVGALSLGGFAVILSWLAWHALSFSFVAVGVVAGAAMHAARAFSRGAPRVDDPPAGDPPADDPPAGASAA